MATTITAPAESAQARAAGYTVSTAVFRTAGMVLVGGAVTHHGSEAGSMTTSIPREVQAYIDAIPPGHRPLFDRLHRLIITAHPGAQVTLSYKMPAYRAGNRRLYVGAWKHGISVYGYGQGRDGGFTSRHPEMVTSKGTIRLRPDGAAGIPDDELLALARAALAP